MTKLEVQTEAFVQGGARVELGDEVALADSSAGLEKYLGAKGPFHVSWIVKWPCGKVMLYLKGVKTGEPGVFASDLVKVQQAKKEVCHA